MNKKILLLALWATITISANAQEIVLENLEDSLRVGWWDKTGDFGINLSQSSFSESWQGGGVSSIALGFLFNYKAIKTKGKGKWTNEIQSQYGFLRNKDEDLRKSNDRIFLESKYSQTIKANINWYGGINFLSQFADGYDFDDHGIREQLVSSFFAPAYLSESVGFEWVPKPYFTFQFGAGAIRQTFVLNQTVFDNTVNQDGKSHGIEPGKTFLNEFGVQTVLAFDKDLTETLNLKWRYQGFLAYAPETKPMDHNISLTATAKFAKYFNFNFTLTGIYDDDQIDSFQLAQGLSAGFSLAF